MDATEGAVHFVLDRPFVSDALVEVVGDGDYRVKKWDELVSALG